MLESYRHMFADIEGELDAMSLWLGLRRSWFQDGKYPHYDLTANKRYDAIHLGAQEITTRKWVEKQRREAR